jgi:hypothetical protein
MVAYSGFVVFMYKQINFSREPSLVAIIFKIIPEFCVYTRFFYLFYRFFSCGHNIFP